MYESDVSKLADFLSKLCGVSVTKRIKQIKQPKGGYISPKMLTTISLGSGIETLNPEENVYPSLVSTAVDYMTRFLLGTPIEEAFRVSLYGASRIKKEKAAQEMLKQISGLDDISLINAMKLVGFDVCFRASAMHYKPVEEIQPDQYTIANVRTMIERSLLFFKQFGPKVLDGFTFEGGYTDTISTGDGDFTTSDTLWDFKVSKAKATKEQTLQLLIYWRMGLHSIHPEFQSIQYLGIFNPRLNIVYRIATKDISTETIQEVESSVIGYK